jgi:hypothetical protein
MASPIPFVPPVTSARLPENSFESGRVAVIGFDLHSLMREHRLTKTRSAAARITSGFHETEKAGHKDGPRFAASFG